jgi:hypothetical protein
MNYVLFYEIMENIALKIQRKMGKNTGCGRKETLKIPKL